MGGQGKLASTILIALLLAVGCGPGVPAPGADGSPTLAIATPAGPADAQTDTTSLPAEPQSTVVAGRPASPGTPGQAAPTAEEQTNPVNSTPGPTPLEPFLQRYVLEAKEDLARRTGLATDQITVLEVQPVTWPDGGLGCPQPGMSYIQVTVDGLLIRLRAGDHDYEYHSGGTRAPFLCQK